MHVPSGHEFNQLDVALAQKLAQANSIELRDEPFTLHSGRTSRVYVHLRDELTRTPSLLSLVGRVTLRTAQNQKTIYGDNRSCRFIGIPAVGNILAMSAAFGAVDVYSPLPLQFAYVRERRKEYGDGEKRLVMGRPEPKFRDVFLDNTITTGGSVLKLEPDFVQDGFDPKQSQHIFFIDREQGGMKALEAAGYKYLAAVYKITDLLHVFGELKLWSKEKVRAAIADIRNG